MYIQYLPQLPLHIDSDPVPSEYRQVIVTNCVFIITFIITCLIFHYFSVFFLFALLGSTVSKRFTDSLHLLFIKHLTNTIIFYLIPQLLLKQGLGIHFVIVSTADCLLKNTVIFTKQHPLSYTHVCDLAVIV
jgi:hypothetical protein